MRVFFHNPQQRNPPGPRRRGLDAMATRGLFQSLAVEAEGQGFGVPPAIDRPGSAGLGLSTSWRSAFEA